MNVLKRRKFLTGASALAGFSITGLGRNKASIIGEGGYRYEVIHDYAKLPDKYSWQTTHNVAVDKDGLLYVMHEGRADQPDHPSIFVFDPEGKFVRAFGNSFQGGGHGLEVRTEGNEQFIYATGYQQVKTFNKMTLTGEMVWEKYAPMDSGVYAPNEDTKREKIWGRDRFLPTNFAFLDDGGFFLADGYGAWCIHRYDKDANWVSKFGSMGTKDGEFRLPHGLWIDDRGDGEPSLAVCDRSNNRVQWFDLDGNHQKTMNDFYLPANIDVLGDTMLIPDLSARITLLDKDNNRIQLGEDPAWREEVLKDKKAMRKNPSAWEAGKFVHPHDACFDPAGNIYVAEWVDTGRISKLRKVD
ncbi:MAG: hypothetical protein P1V20_26690 [Verrucomicrobiales bacterium]|nr:hypothetical protein [Verrucomicrobiales bacterium]